MRPRRRAVLAALACAPWAASAQPADRAFYESAEAQRKLALSWGDQPYGAVLVLDGKIVGEGPSRVVKNGDFTAHAEREAIQDAQKRLGRSDLGGAILYSTSRPCSACETAAARARVSRMIHGPALTDAGPPKS
ncbi:MAG: nucleoside deaminase [Burkholderiales bacterium]|nr:nucleoside deaminase [Burkholderiales bacterium]